MSQQPIVNAPYKYVSDLILSFVNSETLNLSAGAARDFENNDDIILNLPVAIDSKKSGVNGLDTGIVQASKVYAVYVIGDGTKNNDTAALLSLSFLQPSLPFGYDLFRRIGFVSTNPSSDFTNFLQSGFATERVYYFDEPQSPIINGAATVFTDINLSTIVPPINSEIIADLTYNPTNQGTVARFRPPTFSNGSGIVTYGSGADFLQSTAIYLPYTMVSGVPVTQYKVNVATDALTVTVIGVKDYL